MQFSQKPIKQLCSREEWVKSSSVTSNGKLLSLTTQHGKAQHCWQKVVHLATDWKEWLTGKCWSWPNSLKWGWENHCSTFRYKISSMILIFNPPAFSLQCANSAKVKSNHPLIGKERTRHGKAFLQNYFSRSFLIFTTSLIPASESWNKCTWSLNYIWLCCTPSSPDKPAELSR